MKKTFPICEFDPSGTALLNPQDVVQPLPDFPRRAVACFFQDVLDDLYREGKLHLLASLRSEMGTHPIYSIPFSGTPMALFHPGVGAPLAVALLEEVIALGGRQFVVCGAAGVLDRTILPGDLLLPVSALRDEGTSYHYLPPSRETEPHPEALAAVETVLKRNRLSYRKVKTWTTDAIYRETRQRMSRRQAEGCSCVEMEAAALFAVSRFRNIKLAQLLYAGDNLDAETWEERNWQDHQAVRRKLVDLALECAARIP
jgi:uridine phosphorylase